jgi:hypothetical protein
MIFRNVCDYACVWKILRLRILNSSIWYILTHFFRSRDHVRGTATTPHAAPTGIHILEGERDYYLLQNFQTGFGVRPLSYAVVTGVLSHGIKAARDVTFTTYIHLMPRLRKSGAIPLFPLHTLIAWTGTSSHYLTFTAPLVWWQLLLRSPVTIISPCVWSYKFPPNMLPDHTAPRSENGNISEQFTIGTAGSSETLVNTRSYETAYRHITAGLIFNTLKLKV